MLARDNEEFEMYEEFDRMRYDEEKQIYPNFEYGVNYRLITEAEVPDYVKIKEEKKKKVLGKRRNYRELYNVIPDIDISSEEERKSKKRASQRQKRRRQNKAKKNGKGAKASNGKGPGLKRKKTQMNGGEKDKRDAVDSGAANKKPRKEVEKDDIFVDSDD